jgi:hypothetical protein
MWSICGGLEESCLGSVPGRSPSPDISYLNSVRVKTGLFSEKKGLVLLGVIVDAPPQEENLSQEQKRLFFEQF